MALSSEWIDRIHTRLLARYGVAWLRKYPGIEVEVVKADWACELAGYAKNPRALEHALQHLPPDQPPTVGQFAALCRNAPVMSLLRLPAPAPVADPAKRAEIVNSIRAALRPHAASEERSRLLQGLVGRQALGLPLTLFQREMLRELRMSGESACPAQGP